MAVPIAPIKYTCRLCGGSGLIDTYPEGDLVEVTCTRCDGALYEPSTLGAVEGVEPVVVSGVFESYRVLACADPTEYNALTDSQKEFFLLLVSCGKVDLNDGATGKTNLWIWFGAESDTVAALQALIDSA